MSRNKKLLLAPSLSVLAPHSGILSPNSCSPHCTLFLNSNCPTRGNSSHLQVGGNWVWALVLEVATLQHNNGPEGEHNMSPTFKVHAESPCTPLAVWNASVALSHMQWPTLSCHFTFHGFSYLWATAVWKYSIENCRNKQFISFDYSILLQLLHFIIR